MKRWAHEGSNRDIPKENIMNRLKQTSKRTALTKSNTTAGALKFTSQVVYFLFLWVNNPGEKYSIQTTILFPLGNVELDD